MCYVCAGLCRIVFRLCWSPSPPTVGGAVDMQDLIWTIIRFWGTSIDGFVCATFVPDCAAQFVVCAGLLPLQPLVEEGLQTYKSLSYSIFGLKKQAELRVPCFCCITLSSFSIVDTPSTFSPWGRGSHKTRRTQFR